MRCLSFQEEGLPAVDSGLEDAAGDEVGGDAVGTVGDTLAEGCDALGLESGVVAEGGGDESAGSADFGSVDARDRGGFGLGDPDGGDAAEGVVDGVGIGDAADAEGLVGVCSGGELEGCRHLSLPLEVSARNK